MKEHAMPATPPISSPEETVRALYDRFAMGDLDAIDSLLADDVEWTYINGGPSPSRSVRHGKSEVRAFFVDIYQQADLHDFSPRRFMPSAATVTVQGSETARLKADGTLVTSEWVQVFDIEAGVVTRMTEYSIPVPVADQSSGGGRAESVQDDVSCPGPDVSGLTIQERLASDSSRIS